MKSILTATLAAGIFVGLLVPVKAQAENGGRWCTVLSSTDPNRAAAAQAVDCDGMPQGSSGSLHNFAKIEEMSVVIFNPKGKPERVNIAHPDLFAQDIANMNWRREEAVREVVDRELKKAGKPELGNRLINVDAVRIGAKEKVYRDDDARQPLELDQLSVPTSIASLDGKLPLAGEMKCLAKMNEVPHMRAGAILSPGDEKHQPVILLQAKPIGAGEYLGDYVFTPNGFYVNPYRNGGQFSNRQGEHHVEIPGGEGFQPQYYYHAWTPNGSQVPFVQGTPVNARVKLQKLDPSSLVRDPQSQAMQELHKTMLKGTRNFRTDFDSQNPRFRSPLVLGKVRGMIEACKDVAGMQPELGFFENYVFRPQAPAPGLRRNGPDTLGPIRSGVNSASKGGMFKY